MKKQISIILYFISIFLLGLYIALDIIPNFVLSELGRVALLCTSSLFLYFGGRTLSKHTKSKKPLKINLWIFFILYVILFCTLTLFDPVWGRNGSIIPTWNAEILNHYIKNSFNVIPLKTILGYVQSFHGLLSTRILFFNLIGNFICLMPFGFFLPILFPKQRTLKTFLLTVTLFVIGIEALQFLTLSGSCDIDDVILNVAGAFLMYELLKQKELHNLIGNIFLLEKHSLDKKILLKIGAIILVIVSCVTLIFSLR